MFECFTDKANKAIMLAQEESRRLGHNFVGTEQLLLGLIAEGTGVAAKVLRGMGVKLEDARIEVEEIIGLGFGSLAEEIPFTPRCEQVFELSLEEAEQLGYSYASTGHLLLGLLRVEKGVAFTVLENLGVERPKIRTEVIRVLQALQILGGQSNENPAQRLPNEASQNTDGETPLNPVANQEVEATVPTIWKVGDVIQDLYEVTAFLGEGGFGKVYKVWHRGLNMDLAIKSPRTEIVAAAGGVKKFEREAETWVNLGLHPHIVSCYYVRRIENSPLVFAEYVAGGSLQDWIGDRRLYEGGTVASLKRILDIAIQFAWGLHYAHEQGLIHQDVKPANVMLTPEGVVKVTDFGLAEVRAMVLPHHPMGARKNLEGSSDIHTLVAAGSGAMTPAYCSPEQANKETLTRRTDLWSWGLSVLEMFQGERTWSVGTIAAQVLENYLKKGSEHPQFPQMPMAVAQLLRRCFQENPANRPRTMWEVAHELQDIYQHMTGEAYWRPEPKASPDLADSLNNRAISLLDLGRQEEALQLWVQALEVHRQHPESVYNRDLVLWRSGRMSDADVVKELEQARTSQAGKWLINYLLSLVHLERDDCHTALQTLEGIGGKAAQQQEIQTVLQEAQERLPDSKHLLHTFRGNMRRVLSVCLSSDGRYALSGNDDGTVRLWELAMGRCRSCFTIHKNGVSSVYLSRDGCYAVSGSWDCTLKLWEVKNGCCLHTFEGHTGEVTSAHMSSDGCYVLSGSYDKTLKLWEVDKSKCLRTFEGHTSVVTSVCLSSSGDYALSGSGDGTMKLWEVATGRCCRTYTNKWRVNSVCLSSDGHYALSGSQDGKLRLWQVATGRNLQTFDGHLSEVTSVCLSPNDNYALSGSMDGTLKLWEVATGRNLRTFDGHTSGVTSVCLSPDGHYALSGSLDFMLKLWVVNGATKPYLAPMRLSQVLATETMLSMKLTYDRELEKARSAQALGLYVIAADCIRKARSQPGYSQDVEAVNAWASLYISLPRKAFIGSWEGTTFSFSIQRYVERVISLCPLCPSPDGRYALSGSHDGTLKLWDVATGECLRVFEENTSFIVLVSLSSNGRYALSGSTDGTLKFWEVATGQCLQILEGNTNEITSVCLSPDNRYALSGHQDGTLKLWDVATGNCWRTLTGHTEKVNSVCWSPDGRYVLSGSDDKTLKLWEIVTGYCLRTLTGHTEKVNSVCWSPDGRYVLSGSDDKILKLWNVATGSCLHSFYGHTERVNSVFLSQDCRYAMSVSSDKILKFWVLDWELEERSPANWDEGARPYLEIFLIQHIPYADTLSNIRSPKEIPLALTRRGTPTWTEEDFQNLLYTLGCAGYGWLRPEGISQYLESMVSKAAIRSKLPYSELTSALVRKKSLGEELVELASKLLNYLKLALVLLLGFYAFNVDPLLLFILILFGLLVLSDRLWR